MAIVESPVATLDSPLSRTAKLGPTDYWNDSCAVDELAYAIERGATGATSNPSIVLEVLAKERTVWVPRVRELAAANPGWTEVELTWALVEEMAVRGAATLAPIHAREAGRKGWLSVQINPANYTSFDRMIEQSASIREPRAQPPGQVPGDSHGHRGARGGDRARRQHQRHGLVHGQPGGRGSRGGRARSGPAGRVGGQP